MKTQLDQHSPFLHSNTGVEPYGVIENQSIGGKEFNDLVISGALLSLSTFKGVNFRSCVFFATNIENLEFADCTFIDCKFQFTRIEHCQFANVTLENCIWEASWVKKSEFNNCYFDLNSAEQIGKGQNKIYSSPFQAAA